MPLPTQTSKPSSRTGNFQNTGSSSKADASKPAPPTTMSSGSGSAQSFRPIPANLQIYLHITRLDVVQSIEEQGLKIPNTSNNLKGTGSPNGSKNDPKGVFVFEPNVPTKGVPGNGGVLVVAGINPQPDSNFGQAGGAYYFTKDVLPIKGLAPGSRDAFDYAFCVSPQVLNGTNSSQVAPGIANLFNAYKSSKVDAYTPDEALNTLRRAGQGAFYLAMRATDYKSPPSSDAGDDVAAKSGGSSPMQFAFDD